MKFLTRKDKAKLDDLGLNEIFETSFDSPKDFFRANQLNWDVSDRESFMRDMRDFEKDNLRETYKEELEENQPELLKEYKEAQEALAEAKQNLKDVERRLSESQDVLRNTANQIKSGRISQDLKKEDVSRVAFRKQWIYLLFTPETKVFQIIYIRDMYEEEQEKWYNGSYIEDFDFTSVTEVEAEIVEDDEDEQELEQEILAIGQGQHALSAGAQENEQEVESQIV